MPKRAQLQVLACLLSGSVFGWAGVCLSPGANAEIKDFWTGKPSVGELKKRVDYAILSATAQIRSVTGIRGTHTVQNTLCPYDRAGWILNLASWQTGLLRVTHPDVDMRQAAAQAEQQLAQFKSSLRLNRNVFLALRAMDISKEDPATHRYVEREIRAYRLAGVDRDETTRQKI